MASSSSCRGCRARPSRSELVDNQTSKFDLTFGIEPDGDAYALVVEYSTDLFDAETVHRMGGHFRSLLAAAAADPDRRVGDLPLLDGDERRQILVDWNATGTDFPSERCLHELIAARAHQQPEARRRCAATSN